MIDNHDIIYNGVSGFVYREVDAYIGFVKKFRDQSPKK